VTGLNPEIVPWEWRSELRRALRQTPRIGFGQARVMFSAQTCRDHSKSCAPTLGACLDRSATCLQPPFAYARPRKCVSDGKSWIAGSNGAIGSSGITSPLPVIRAKHPGCANSAPCRLHNPIWVLFPRFSGELITWLRLRKLKITVSLCFKPTRRDTRRRSAQLHQSPQFLDWWNRSDNTHSEHVRRSRVLVQNVRRED